MSENRIKDWAKFIESYENVNKTYNNPGALKKNGQLQKFPTYEEGWKALINQLTIACTGKSAYYKPTDTLTRFFEIYAPRWDNNDSLKYANACAKALNVSPTIQIQELYNPSSHVSIQKILCILLNYSTEREDIIKEGFKKVKRFFDSLGIETELTFSCTHVFNPSTITIKSTSGLNNEPATVSVLNPQDLRFQYENLVENHHFVMVSYASKGGLTPVEFSEAYKGALWGQLPVLDISDAEWVATFATHEILHGWYYRARSKSVQLIDEVHTHAWGDIRKEFNYSDIVNKLKPYIPQIFQPVPDNLYALLSKKSPEEQITFLTALVEKLKAIINLFIKF